MSVHSRFFLVVALHSLDYSTFLHARSIFNFYMIGQEKKLNGSNSLAITQYFYLITQIERLLTSLSIQFCYDKLN